MLKFHVFIIHSSNIVDIMLLEYVLNILYRQACEQDMSFQFFHLPVYKLIIKSATFGVLCYGFLIFTHNLCGSLIIKKINIIDIIIPPVIMHIKELGHRLSFHLDLREPMYIHSSSLLSFLIPQAATFQALSLYDFRGLKPIVIR